MNILCILLLVILLILEVNSVQKIVPSFHWNYRHRLFQKNPKQRELCTEPAHIYVEYGAELFFICPHVFLDVSQSKKRLARETLYENIHFVNKEGFDSCKVDRSNSLLVECDKSSNVNLLNYEQVTFDRVNWNGWVFLPNNTYYFINTSNGTKASLKNKEGGRCKTHNMKLKVTVCDPAQGCSKCKDMCCEKPPTTRPPTTTPTTTPTTVTTTKITTTEQLTVPAINDRNGESGEETMARTKEDTNATTITSRPRTTQIHTTIETVLASTQKTKIESNKISTKPSVTFKFGGEGNNTVEGKSLKSTGTQSNSKHDPTEDRLIFIFSGVFIGIVISMLAVFAKRKYDKRKKPEQPSPPLMNGKYSPNPMKHLSPHLRSPQRGADAKFARLQSVSSTVSTTSNADSNGYPVNV
eukprot:Seg2916.1 transcript_id=Seg2916.1/GoldUCD/mRNA.D3Y31 product=Ephrin-B2 protein_id=Seg2916.1/GoldUCD/D3Y31